MDNQKIDTYKQGIYVKNLISRKKHRIIVSVSTIIPMLLLIIIALAIVLPLVVFNAKTKELPYSDATYLNNVISELGKKGFIERYETQPKTKDDQLILNVSDAFAAAKQKAIADFKGDQAQQQFAKEKIADIKLSNVKWDNPFLNNSSSSNYQITSDIQNGHRVILSPLTYLRASYFDNLDYANTAVNLTLQLNQTESTYKTNNLLKYKDPTSQSSDLKKIYDEFSNQIVKFATSGNYTNNHAIYTTADGENFYVFGKRNYTVFDKYGTATPDVAYLAEDKGENTITIEEIPGNYAGSIISYKDQVLFSNDFYYNFSAKGAGGGIRSLAISKLPELSSKAISDNIQNPRLAGSILLNSRSDDIAASDPGKIGLIARSVNRLGIFYSHDKEKVNDKFTLYWAGLEDQDNPGIGLKIWYNSYKYCPETQLSQFNAADSNYEAYKNYYTWKGLKQQEADVGKAGTMDLQQIQLKIDKGEGPVSDIHYNDFTVDQNTGKLYALAHSTEDTLNNRSQFLYEYDLDTKDTGWGKPTNTNQTQDHTYSLQIPVNDITLKRLKFIDNHLIAIGSKASTNSEGNYDFYAFSYDLSHLSNSTNFESKITPTPISWISHVKLGTSDKDLDYAHNKININCYQNFLLVNFPSDAEGDITSPKKLWLTAINRDNFKFSNVKDDKVSREVINSTNIFKYYDAEKKEKIDYVRSVAISSDGNLLYIGGQQNLYALRYRYV